MPTEITYGEMNALYMIKHRDSRKAMSRCYVLTPYL